MSTKQNPTVIRVQKNKENPYVMVDKTCVNDVRLSWKAKGLHTYLLSLPDDWEIYLNELTRHSKDGRDGTASAMKELEKFGYIIKDKTRTNTGQFNCIYTIFEIPQIVDIEPKITETEKPKRVSRFGKSVTTKYLKSNNNKLYNKTTTKEPEEPVVVSQELINTTKKEIETVIKSEISTRDVEKVLNQYGEIPVKFCLDNWDKFSETPKRNPTAFFLTSLKVGFKPPKINSVTYGIGDTPDNRYNFDQREYTKDDFNKYYFNVEEYIKNTHPEG